MFEETLAGPHTVSSLHNFSLPSTGCFPSIACKSEVDRYRAPGAEEWDARDGFACKALAVLRRRRGPGSTCVSSIQGLSRTAKEGCSLILQHQEAQGCSPILQPQEAQTCIWLVGEAFQASRTMPDLRRAQFLRRRAVVEEDAHVRAALENHGAAQFPFHVCVFIISGVKCTPALHTVHKFTKTNLAREVGALSD